MNSDKLFKSKIPERTLQYGLIPLILILPLVLVQLPFISTAFYLAIFSFVAWGAYVSRNKDSAILEVYNDHFKIIHPFYFRSPDIYLFNKILNEPSFRYKTYRTWFFIRRTHIVMIFIYGTPAKNEFIHLNMAIEDFLKAISLTGHKLKLFQTAIGDQIRSDPGLSARVVDQLHARGLSEEEIDMSLNEEGLSEPEITEAKESYKDFVKQDHRRAKKYLIIQGSILVAISSVILMLSASGTAPAGLIFWPSIVLIGGLRLLYVGLMKY